MEPERFRAIDDTYEALRELPTAARGARLVELREIDPALCREVEALLAAESRLAGEHSFLAGPLEEEAGRLARVAVDKPLAIAGYELGEVLGRGGGGVVYRAKRRSGDPAELALKVGWATLSKFESRRFRREHEILSRLAHPGITTFYDYGTTPDGRPYLVMELLEGEPIDRYCDHLQLQVARRVELFAQLCEAVHHVHRMGVVHRDIKPGNVLVTREGRVKLLDFGIAKALDSGTFQTRLDPTDSQIHLVTPGYCSPEQLLGKKITPASDVYSLAVVLFELLTGTKPYLFTNSSPQVLDLLQAVCDRPPCTLSEALDLAEDDSPWAKVLCRQRGVADLYELRRQWPRRLEQVLARALSQAPERRPITALTLAEEVKQSIAGGLLTRIFKKMIRA